MGKSAVTADTASVNGMRAACVIAIVRLTNIILVMSSAWEDGANTGVRRGKQMTLNGAIAELVLLHEHPMMPVIFKSSIQKIIETVSECEEPSAQPEIVRCKDCKYQDKGSNESDSWNLCGYRPWQYVITDDEHYCGYAERRTDESDKQTD